MSGSHFGMFEVAAAAPDERRLAAQAAQDKLAAAIYDVREEFGDFLFKAATVHEFRNRIALVKPDMLKVINRHVMPVTGIVSRVVGNSDGSESGGLPGLERQFKAQLAGDRSAYMAPQTQDDLVETRHPQERLDEYHHNQRQEGEEPAEDLHVLAHYEDAGMRRQAHFLSILATGDGPPLDTDETFTDHQGEDLIPEGDFKGYLDSVDQGAPGKVDHCFTSESSRRQSVRPEYEVTSIQEDIDRLRQRGDERAERTRQKAEELAGRPHPKVPTFIDHEASRRQSWQDADDFQPAPDPGAPPKKPFGQQYNSDLDVWEMGAPYGEHALHKDVPRSDWGQHHDDIGGNTPAMQVNRPSVLEPGGGKHEAAVHAIRTFAKYLKFCRKNRLSLSLLTLERHGRELSSSDYLTVAAGLDKVARATKGVSPHVVGQVASILIRQAEASAWDYDDYGAKTPEQDQPQHSYPKPKEAPYRGHPGDVPPAKGREPDYFVPGKYPYASKARQVTAAPDYLQKATEALTNFLNQCAEQFQTEITPMQQALQVVQQAQQAAQAANPLSVVPAAGTVNVLPEPPAGAAGPAGGAPAPDSGAPPPAAAAAGVDGGGAPPLPPDPTQDPSLQMAAGRRRIGNEYPSDDPAQHYADWHDFQGLNLAEHPKHLPAYAHETAATPAEIKRIREVHGSRGGHPKGRRVPA